MRLAMRSLALFLVFLTTFAPKADAQRIADSVPSLILGDASSIHLEHNLSILDDENGLLTLEQVTRHPGFKPLGNLQLATGTLWLRATIIRSTGTPATWVLAFGEPGIHDVRAMIVAQDGSSTELVLGRHIASNDLPLAALRHVALLELPEGKPVTLYLRVSSLHKIRFESPILCPPTALLFEEVRQSTLYGAWFAALACITVIYALLGAWMKDGALLTYAAYVGTKISRGIAHTGIAYVIFPSAGGNTDYWLGGIGLLGGTAAFLLIWDKVLDLKANFPRMHILYCSTAIVVMILLFSADTPAFDLFATANQTIIFIASSISIVLAIRLVRRKVQRTVIHFYLFAFLPVWLSWAVQILTLLTPLIPASLGRGIDVASTPVHILILSCAMIYRLSQAQRERLRIQIALEGERMARQRQRAFIDMATHEFKTPLAVIDSAAQLLELQTPVPAVAERLSTIRRAIRRLVTLVETCLADHREDTRTVNLRPASPREIIERTAARNHNFGTAEIVVRAGNLPETCLADPDLLGIALDALVGNARLYGDASHPIEITADEDDHQVVFAVHDRGPGVPEAEAERIFEKYYRSSSTSAVPGTGIGLYLVKTIAGLHRGQVRYQHREGGGASFLLTIPGD